MARMANGRHNDDVAGRGGVNLAGAGSMSVVDVISSG